MILGAAKKYNIDLAASYMVGDDARDTEAGRTAGCAPVLLKEQSGTEPLKAGQSGSMMSFSNLREFAENVI
jgi:histidinol phosphatase-like enzyme